MNHEELNRFEFRDIKTALFGTDNLFDYMDIDKERIPAVQQYQWMISGQEYMDLTNLGTAEYIESPPFRYQIGVHELMFHLHFYGQSTSANSKCAIFLNVAQMPEIAKRFRIEVDFKCLVFAQRSRRGQRIGKNKIGQRDNGKEYRQLVHTQILTKKDRSIGFQVFEHEELERNTCMVWTIAVKIWDIERTDVDMEDEYLLEMYRYLAVQN